MGILKQLGKSFLTTVAVMGAFLGIIAFLQKANFFSVRIPNWLMLTLIVFLFFLFFNIAYFLSRNPRTGRENDFASKGELEELKGNFEKHRKAIGSLEIELRQKINQQGQTIASIYNSPYDHINLEPSEEIVYVLSLLADEKQKDLDTHILNEAYLKKYGGNKQAEYNILIDKLKNYGLIRQPDSGYDTPYTEITSRGLAYYERTRTEIAL
jgi:hypothetical protein